jgi:hypothetical protein
MGRSRDVIGSLFPQSGSLRHVGIPGPGTISIMVDRVGTPHEIITKNCAGTRTRVEWWPSRMLSQPPFSVTARIPRRKERLGPKSRSIFLEGAWEPGQPMETCSVPPAAKTRSPTCPLLHACTASAHGRTRKGPLNPVLEASHTAQARQEGLPIHLTREEGARLTHVIPAD